MSIQGTLRAPATEASTRTTIAVYRTQRTNVAVRALLFDGQAGQATGAKNRRAISLSIFSTVDAPAIVASIGNASGAYRAQRANVAVHALLCEGQAGQSISVRNHRATSLSIFGTLNAIALEKSTGQTIAVYRTQRTKVAVRALCLKARQAKSVEQGIAGPQASPFSAKMEVSFVPGGKASY
jgi:hypothetical protein